MSFRLRPYDENLAPAQGHSTSASLLLDAKGGAVRSRRVPFGEISNVEPTLGKLCRSKTLMAPGVASASQRARSAADTLRRAAEALRGLDALAPRPTRPSRLADASAPPPPPVVASAEPDPAPQQLFVPAQPRVLRDEPVAVAVEAPHSARARMSGAPSELADVDRADLNNPQAAAEYAAEIVSQLQAEEVPLMPNPKYMEDCQPGLTSKMRAILVDWLVEVHSKFKLSPSTLFATVQLIDRYLGVAKSIPRARLQLVGVTCLLIAAKFEEIYPPQIDDLVYITDLAYKRSDITVMEIAILNGLGFEVPVATPHFFLMRYVKLAACLQLHSHTAQFLMELTLTDYAMIRHRPSLVACAVLYLSNRIFKTSPSWPSLLQSTTGYEEAEVKPVAKEICCILQQSEQSSLKAVRKKFAHQKFSSVSRIIVS
mmetsp:Transcript_35285/g.77252  ORF Transcript_35285/g.77252 Transcript_35285/m.77252 type:complete len:428 (+) Transcript_35285:77-1360(+)